MKKILQIVILYIFITSGTLFCQPNPIGLGWAKNSVNTTIFRKNAVTTFNGIQFAAYYDSLGTVMLAKRQIDSDNWQVHKTQYSGNVQDAHNSISIAVDGNGYLHMAWDHHGHPLRYCTSTDSFALTLDEKQNMIGTLENVVTYPEFSRMPNGDLLFIYRDGWSGNANCVINRYNVTDKKWTRLQDNLISGEDTRSAYWQSFVDTNGVIHISWVWRESANVSSNHDLCYAKSNDGGMTWYKSTGEKYILPITAASAEYVWHIEQNNELINQTSMYATSDSKPYIVSYWKDGQSNRPQYQLLYLDDEGEWQRKTLSNRQTSFSLSGGGTKKIPISRPQIVVEEGGETPVIYLLYRDRERANKVSMNVCTDIETNPLKIIQYDITDFSVDDWEPGFDIDLWKTQKRLDLFVQRTQQGDGETLGNLCAQPVFVWTVPDKLAAVDTIYIPNEIFEKDN